MLQTSVGFGDWEMFDGAEWPPEGRDVSISFSTHHTPCLCFIRPDCKGKTKISSALFSKSKEFLHVVRMATKMFVLLCLSWNLKEVLIILLDLGRPNPQHLSDVQLSWRRRQHSRGMSFKMIKLWRFHSEKKSELLAWNLENNFNGLTLLCPLWPIFCRYDLV